MVRDLLNRWHSLERGPDVVLMQLAPIPGSGAVTGCTGVAVPAPLRNNISCLRPVVPLLGLIQGTVDTQVAS
jgi:hypothetical protein